MTICRDQVDPGCSRDQFTDLRNKTEIYVESLSDANCVDTTVEVKL